MSARGHLLDEHDLRCAVMRGADPDMCSCRDEHGRTPRATRPRKEHAVTELNPDAAATLAKLRDTQAQIKQLTEDAELYKSQLRDELGAGAFTVGGRPALSITPTRRFDPVYAEQALPVEWRAACQRYVVDGALARQVLPPALYEACVRDAGKPSVKPA